MQDFNYRKQKSKSSLQVLTGGGQRRGTLRQTGVVPSESMPAGTYTVTCEDAHRATKWGRPFIECSFRVVEGEHFGTALPGWIDFKPVGEDRVDPSCEYAKMCARLLGREQPGDDIHWDTILVGKLMTVETRFRLTNGRSRDPEDASQKKDGKDFLRVTKILSYGSL